MKENIPLIRSRNLNDRIYLIMVTALAFVAWKITAERNHANNPAPVNAASAPASANAIITNYQADSRQAEKVYAGEWMHVRLDPVHQVSEFGILMHIQPGTGRPHTLKFKMRDTAEAAGIAAGSSPTLLCLIHGRGSQHSGDVEFRDC